MDSQYDKGGVLFEKMVNETRNLFWLCQSGTIAAILKRKPLLCL